MLSLLLRMLPLVRRSIGWPPQQCSCFALVPEHQRCIITTLGDHKRLIVSELICVEDGIDNSDTY